VDLVVHIGLPKTMTTLWQEHIFPRAGVYSGRPYRTPSARLFGNAVTSWRANGRASSSLLRRWVKSIQSIDETVIVSDEELSDWPAKNCRGLHPLDDHYVAGKRQNERPVIDFLRSLQEEMPLQSRLRAIVTLRDQAEWMASAYVQTAPRMRTPGQPDFSKKVLNLIESDDHFLEYDRLVKSLSTLLGQKNVLVVFYENGARESVIKLQEFLKSRWTVDDSDLAPKKVSKVSAGKWERDWKEPASKSGARARVSKVIWARTPSQLAPAMGFAQHLAFKVDKALKNSAGAKSKSVEIELTTEMADRIDARYSESNQRLATHLELSEVPFSGPIPR